MKREEIVSVVNEVFVENGIDCDSQIEVEEMDSLEYISILVGLEEKLDIELPDSMLVRNMFIDMEDMITLLGFLLGNK